MGYEIDEKYRKVFYSELPPEAVKSLSELSNILVSNESETVNLSLVETSINLKEGLTNAIEVKSNAIGFKQKEYFFLAYAEFICQNEIVGKSSEPNEIIKTIQEADWNLSQIVNEHILMEEVFICLKRRHNVNIIPFVNGLTKSRRDFWDIYPKLCYVLKVVEFNVDELVSFLSRTEEFRRGDMMSGYISNTFAYLAKHKPNVAKEIKTKFMATESGDLVFLLGGVFVEFSKNNFNEEFESLYQLTFSDKVFEINFGITTLARLDYNEYESLLSRTENRLKELIENTDTSIAVGCCRAIYFLIDQERVEFGDLLLIADHNIPEIQAELSWILNAHKSKIYSLNWSRTILKRMANVNSEYDRITGDLDQYLSFLLSYKPNEVEQFFEAWILNHEGEGLDLSKVFSSTLIELKSRIELLQKILTKYLNSDDFKFHLVTGFITSSFFKSEEKQGGIYLELDEKLISEFDFRDSKYVLFKILGFVFDSHQKCSLVFSLLKNKTVKEIKDLVVNAFFEVILYEYPPRKDFIELKSKSGSEVEKEVAEIILNRFGKYEKALDKLEDLNELKPSRHKLRSQQIIERERRKQIHEGARKSSVLLEVVKNITTKYGRGWTYYHEGKIVPPSYMASISTSFSIPRTLYISPTEAQFQSFQWRTILREDVL